MPASFPERLDAWRAGKVATKTSPLLEKWRWHGGVTKNATPPVTARKTTGRVSYDFRRFYRWQCS
jgi:hypothetical protein